jgi:hypothetical protein
MTFRQFPATTADGQSWIVLEFRAETPGAEGALSTHPPRYELADGRPLIRQGSHLGTADGAVRLSLNQPYRA